jgi:hypothetical protein
LDEGVQQLSLWFTMLCHRWLLTYGVKLVSVKFGSERRLWLRMGGKTSNNQLYVQNKSNN